VGTNLRSIDERSTGLRVALTHVFAWPEVRRGGERYLHELAGALVEAGHHVSILATGSQPGRARIAGAEVRYLPRRSALHRWFPGQGHEIAFAAQALLRLGSHRFDIWHALGTADAAAAALLSSVRRVRSVYTDLGIPDRPYRGSRSDWRLHEFVVRRIDDYICLSHTAGDELRRGFGREPVVLGGGVDIRTFHPAERRHPTPALLFASDVSEARKNAALLFKAVALLRERRPQLELWLAGPGDPADVLSSAPRATRDAVVQLGAGSLQSLTDLYGRAWVTVLPSQLEAFGLVVLESLACGTPVVTLSHTAPAELFGPDVGVACEPTPEALADACDRAIEMSMRPDIVEACRATASPHDWRTSVVPRIEEIYRGGTGPIQS